MSSFNSKQRLAAILAADAVGYSRRMAKIKPERERCKLADLLSATPKGLHRSKGWDELPTVGAER